MLDSDTKRRIDTCRDILVGKVPDPKSQVEQITVALIYKFMNDMDLESEELGGARKFFTDEYERYRWSNLVASGVSGQDMLNTYSEALTKMVENEKLPPLFRTIFRNAYLPYRDPETLRSFLREIDSFEYDHSERLGDAFEYLLSVLGSQGDAGQFRTPRHIIDFMVEIIDPKKNETIMDPACGTAGFLISAYKHILKANTSVVVPSHLEIETKDASEQTIDSPLRYSGDKLTNKDRALLAKNIFGYDISPDMVRLSLVNLYLHGFANPKIEEYDTLTSDAKWGDMADVILANPPFMSPKGGIKPHNRFQVQSKRSEVLFVDYIAEHLTKAGRAAIVVPEGIIFQSQNAYKDLRKMLVENHLAAVISLPGGVFNPYSGVKTSILILDRSLAKASDHIAFFKIENDGFALGSQRRAQKGSELPIIKSQLAQWMEAARKGNDKHFESEYGFSVKRIKISKDGEYGLNADRYKKVEVSSSQFPIFKLGDLCDLYQPKTIGKKDMISDGEFPVFGANGIIGRYDQFNHTEEEVLITCRGATCGTINRSLPRAWITGNAMVATPKDDRVSKGYLFQLLKSSNLSSTITGSAQPQITRQNLSPFKIPLPPLETQKEIVSEIEVYQKVIDGARVVIDNYRPKIIIDPDWPLIPLGELSTRKSGGTPSKQEPKFWDGDVPWVSPKDMKSQFLTDTIDHVTMNAVEESSTKLIPEGTVLCVVRSGILKHSFPVAINLKPMCFNQDIVALRVDETKLLAKFLLWIFKTYEYKILKKGIKPGITVQSFHSNFFKDYLIALPPIHIQESIIAEIEAEQVIVDSNNDLIFRFEKKIDDAIKRVWGKAETDI